MTGTRDKPYARPRRIAKPVVPTDPFGKSNKYRQTRLLLLTNGVYRALFWFIRATDDSLSFGLSSGSRVDAVGFAKSQRGRLVPFSGRSVEDVPLEHRSQVHASLHPTGQCHVRAGKNKLLARHDLTGWHPVTQPFTWLYAVSEPVLTIPIEQVPRLRDAIVAFPNADKSARVRIDVVPKNNTGEYEYKIAAVDTVLLLGQRFIVRFTIDEHRPHGAALAIGITQPLTLDPL